MMCVGASPNAMVDRWPDTYVRLALHRHQFAAHAARIGAAAMLRRIRRCQAGVAKQWNIRTVWSNGHEKRPPNNSADGALQ